MQLSDQKLCFGCMEPLDGDHCPHCGYEQDSPQPDNFLRPGTTLHDGRYLIGKALDSNGEGVTYIGYDHTAGCKCLIREYLPAQLCSRAADGTTINVTYAHLAQYKALMAEYTELNKALARLRNLSHLNPALDLFSENNTTYGVHEYLEGRTLLEYLKENAGELSWSTVRRIFPPLFTTLSLLHNAGVLHRGLSADTIFVTELGELKLLGFCISAVRTNDTELTAELFEGYAAPEQYYADRQQGTWTDVYGICAVLYRILTGARAMDAISRQDDEILPPAELNPQIPEHVSKVIMQGLSLDGNARVRTITDLVTLLFEEDEEETTTHEKLGSTAVYQTPAAAKAVTMRTVTPPARQPVRKAPAQRSSQNPPMRPAQTRQNANYGGQRRPAPAQQRYPQQNRSRNAAPQRRPSSQQQRRRQEEVSFFERVRAPLFIAFLFTAIVALIVVIFTRLIQISQPGIGLAEGSSSVADNVVPATTTESTEPPHYDYEIPELVGKNYQIKKDELASWVELIPEFVFDDHFMKDTIMWQEFPKGTDFVSGSTMKVKVSLGPSLVTIPEFKGKRLQTYLNDLKELGFAEGVDGGNNNMPSGIGGNIQKPGNVPNNPDENGKKHLVIYQAKIDYNYSDGMVCAVDPKPGSKVDALQDYQIIVYYAYNPVYTTISNMSSTNDSSSTKKSKTTKTTTTTSDTTKNPPKTTSTPPATTAPPATTTPPTTAAPPPPQTTAAPPPAATPEE